jgi:hypothetical protein
MGELGGPTEGGSRAQHSARVLRWARSGPRIAGDNRRGMGAAMAEIELSAGAIRYEDSGGEGRWSSRAMGC